MSFFTQVKVTDGNTTAGVTTASTPATAAQPAVVVGLSPNSPLPTGTNTIGTVNVNGGATSANQTTEIAALGTINTTLGSPIQQTGGSVALVAGSASVGNVGINAGSNNIGSITNITGTVSLPTGAATSALQTTANTTLASINTTLGSPLQAGGNVAVTASALPTGAATSANQTTEIAALGTINTSVGSLTTANHTDLLAIKTTLGSPMQTTGGTVGLVDSMAIIGSVRLTNGTNTAAVTAASTAATAAQSAVVVAVSPNSPVSLATGSTVSISQSTYGASNGVFVGGTSQIQVIPTVTVGAYTAGQVVGGLLSFGTVVNSTVLSGVIQSITVANKINYVGGWRLNLFMSVPATTFTDKTTPAIGVADAAKWLDEIYLPNAIQTLGTACSFYNSDNIGSANVLAGSTLYGVLTCVGAPTFVTSTDVIVTVKTLRD